MQRSGAPGIWMQIELRRVGGDVQVSARSSRGEEAKPHRLGPDLSERLSGFAAAVCKKAGHMCPLSAQLLEDARALQQGIVREDTGKMFQRLTEAARGQGEGRAGPLLVRLLLHDDDLKAVPWEALATPGTAMGFWGSSADVLPVRAVTRGDPWEPREVRGALRVLAIAPGGGIALKVLRGALAGRIDAGKVEWLQPVEGEAASPRRLFERLRRESAPHVIHFIGHGGMRQGIALVGLADEDGTPARKEGDEGWLAVETFAQQLRASFSGSLRLVVLEACEGAGPSDFGSAAEILCRAGADAAVAHLWPVRADVARLCSEVLYRALTGTGRGQGHIAFALNEARRSILAAFDNTAEAFSPVVYLRGPDGVLFDFKGREAEPDSPPEATAAPLFEGPGAAPAEPVPHFLGRDDEMAELRDALAASTGAVCVVATGIGGIGKTALVQQFVATEAREMFAGGVAWIDAMTLPSEVTRVVQRFGWTEPRQPAPEEAKAWIARTLHDRRVLLVIDNVDPGRVDPKALPVAGGQSRTVLTSRMMTLHEMLGREARPLPLGRWAKPACREYLREVVPALQAAGDGDLDSLADFVGELPLAVRLLARLLLRPGATPHAVLDRLERKPIELLEKVATGADRGIAATFQASFDALDEQKRRVLIALASCARGTRGNVVASVAGVAESDAVEALSDLAEGSLVEHTPGERPWGLHDVVRLLGGHQPGSAQADAAHLRFAQTHVEEHRNPTDWQAMESEMPEVLAAVDRLVAAKQGEYAWSLLGEADGHMRRRGRYVDLIGRYQRLLDCLPVESTGHAAVLGNLGVCYQTQGDISKAIDYLQRSLAIEEKLGRLEGQASDLGNLGLCCGSLGDISKAIEYLQRSLAIDEKLGRLEGQAIQLGNLGLCYQTQGDISKAIDYLQRALAINEKLGRLEGQATQLGNLGTCYGMLGDISKATDYFHNSLAIDEKLGRLEGQATQLGNLGLCYQTLGKVPEAIDYFQRALILFRRMGLADSHPSIQKTLSALDELGG